MKRILLVGFLFFGLFAGPLAHTIFTGWPDNFFAFPPLISETTQHAPFSLLIFSTFAVGGMLFFLLLILPGLFGLVKHPSFTKRSTKPFPPWGFIGGALIFLFWSLAWLKPSSVTTLHHHTFFPLWLGFILLIDAWTFKRTGASTFHNRRLQFFILFITSAAVWWTFEFLNRFMKNWWYAGDELFQGWHYVIHSTLCFATVLPAVLGTTHLLLSFSHFRNAYHLPFTLSVSQPWAFLISLIGLIGLMLMPVFPDPLFFMLWAAPLAWVGGTMLFTQHATPLDHLGELLAFCTAGLICGLFWEMWNYWSFPKWHYSVPYVDQFHLFEMPIVGYTGYLPFGVFCGLMGYLFKLWPASQPSSTTSLEH